MVTVAQCAYLNAALPYRVFGANLASGKYATEGFILFFHRSLSKRKYDTIRADIG